MDSGKHFENQKQQRSRDAISPDVSNMTNAVHVKQQAISETPKYKGKYPGRIKALSCAPRAEGERFAPILIETNDGARFVYRLLHRDAPMPKIGQDVANWLLHIEPTNDQGRAACQRHGIEIFHNIT